MNDNNLIIEPQKGLGFFKLESTVNFIISEIRSRGERYEHSDIAAGENANEPIYIVLNKEGIKFRFDQIYQRLELIEIDVRVGNKERTHNVYYKNNVLLQSVSSNSNSSVISNNSKISEKNTHALTYNYINSIFGPSSMPKVIDNNKFILLRYDGVSFLFENPNYSNSSPEINEEYIATYGSDLSLTKISIFSERFLIDSISKENSLFKNPQQVVRVDIDKGILITNVSSSTGEQNEQNENSLASDISICFDESLQNVLSKLKNPNFVYYKKNDNIESNDYDSDNSFANNTETSSDYLNTDDCDFFLNYYSIGLDILFDASSLKVKKFIFHTNNPFDLKFGIYNRCNFIIEFNKGFLRKLEKINEVNSMNDRESMNLNNNSNTSPKSRKISVDSNQKVPYTEDGNNFSLNFSYTENNACNNDNFKIEKTENLQYSNGKNEKEKDYLGYKDNYSVNMNVNMNVNSNTKEDGNYNTIYQHTNNLQTSWKRKRSEYKTSIESKDNLNMAEKSFCSMNESNLSISFNTSDIFMNLIIFPSTNFLDIINRIPPNSFVLYHRHESKLNLVSKYYSFDGIIIEVLENYSISSVTLVKPLFK